MRLLWTAAVMAWALLGCGGDDAESTGTGPATTGAGAAGTGGSGGSGGGGCVVDTTYDPMLDAASFASSVDNSFYPLVPGTVFVYDAGEEHVEVTVLAETKEILGITCTVVHDQATIAGKVIEDTMDWFAQDADGAVWYMGEDTKEFNDAGEVVSIEGSWEAGRDGAKPGIIIPAIPTVGQTYRQEYYACHAEDMGEVLALDETATTPAGMYTGCLKTRDTTPLEPTVKEEKFYCPPTGLVLSVDTASMEREELTSVTP
jgi:hypothetical protein